MKIDLLLKNSYKADFLFHFLDLSIISNDKKILDYFLFFFDLFLKKNEDMNNNHTFFILINHEDDSSILKEFNSKHNRYSVVIPIYYPYALRGSFCDNEFYFNIDDLVIGIYNQISKEAIIVFNKIFLNQGPSIFLKAFTIVLSELLRYKNYFMLHCSSLCYRENGVNFIGPGGYGKSTILTNLLKYEDFMYLSDDVTIFGKEGGSFRAYAFTNKVNLLSDTINRINSNQGIKIIPYVRSREGKYFCEISGGYKDNFKYSCPVKYNIFLSNERYNDVRVIEEPPDTLNLLSDNSNMPFSDDYLIYHINNINKLHRSSRNFRLFLTNNIKESTDYIYKFIEQIDKS